MQCTIADCCDKNKIVGKQKIDGLLFGAAVLPITIHEYTVLLLFVSRFLETRQVEFINKELQKFNVIKLGGKKR